MLATLREYTGTTERDRRFLELINPGTPITIGRSDLCTYKIGMTLGNLALGISKVQATITFEQGEIRLKDGGADGLSTNGIYCHGEKLETPIALVPGLELTLFKHGIAKVTLHMTDLAVVEHGRDTYTGQDLLSVLQEQVADLAVVEHGRDTYTGQELLSVLQEQVATMGGQMDALQFQIGLLGTQLAHREVLDRTQDDRDRQQEQRLLTAEKRLNRVVVLLLVAIAVIVLAFGWSGGNSEDKKQWSSTFTSIAIGIAALYLKSKETPRSVPV